MKRQRSKPLLPDDRPVSLCPGLWGGRHRREGVEGYLVYDPARGREEFFSGPQGEALARLGAGRPLKVLNPAQREAVNELWRRGLLALTPHQARAEETPPPPQGPFATLPGASFRCHACGLCCRALHALGPVTEPERDHLVQITPRLPQVKRKSPAQLLQLSPPEEPGGRWLYQIATQRGRCVYLTPETRCTIHQELGGEHKPLTCQAFPLQLSQIAGQSRGSRSGRCPAASLSEGDPLSQTELARLSSQGAPVLRPDEPACGWVAYLDAEAFLLEQLSPQNPPASIRAACGAFLARLGFPEVPELNPGVLHAMSRRLVHEQGPRGGEAIAVVSWGLRWRLGMQDKSPARPWRGAFEHPNEAGRSAQAVLLEHLRELVFAGELLIYRDLPDAAFRLWVRSSLIRSQARALVQSGLSREPRATAEAIYLWEIAAGSDAWRRLSPKLGSAG
jgi:Fe-S-cluster containining protein